MDFEAWEPWYCEILEYFGFSREQDEEAARILGSLVTRDDLPALSALIRGREVTVCGNAPCLKYELPKIRGIVCAADAAADVLYSHGFNPDVVFTDLDGATDYLINMNESGTIVVVHAHGDNISLLRYWIPRFPGPLVGTTQSVPFPHIYNFGGFSDGDRAVFAADELGALKINLVGFDLDDENVDPVKRGKLFWARKLLAAIGYAC